MNLRIKKKRAKQWAIMQRELIEQIELLCLIAPKIADSVKSVAHKIVTECTRKVASQLKS